MKGIAGRLIMGCLVLAILAASVSAGTSRPPRTGYWQESPARHWTPYSPPESLPEGAQIHIIIRGDTLWDLSQAYLNNPFLWPKIWEANGYITDPHWIYPGDPLIIPPVEVVTDEDLTPPAPPPPPPPPVEPVPAWSPSPVANWADLHCTGWIGEADFTSKITGAEEPTGKKELSTNDYVYISGGSADGVVAGQKYYIYSDEGKVRHPHTGDTLGHYYRQSGTLEVIVAQENTATAEIISGCYGINRNDGLIPAFDLVSPLEKKPSEWDRFTVPQGNLTGTVVHWTNGETPDTATLGEFQIIFIDLGENDGVSGGEYITIYRDGESSELPPVVLGEAVIISTSEDTAAARITYSIYEIEMGDFVTVQ